MLSRTLKSALGLLLLGQGMSHQEWIPAYEAVLGMGSEPAVEGKPLVSLGEPEFLRTSYGLEVVPVAPPPFGELDESTLQAPVPANSCPLEVRAIVIAEDASAHFAVVATEDESQVVRRGEKFASRGSHWTVDGIDRHNVFIRRGDVISTCSLSR